ncbi:hypothetical protein M422DRAFT_239681 [Sphaerobolus stellatus SS14]|nr:hypothetical protein M422DRAFT_239681 [Sphaerobolus stellatus SS14]
MPADIVTASLTYFEPPKDGSTPYQYVDADPVTGERKSNFTEVGRPMEIENVRGKEDQYNIDNAGFQFVKHKAKHNKFTDDDEIRREYYPESVALLRKITGARRIIIFDHTIRRYKPGQIDDGPNNRQPYPRVHVDQTREAAARRVRMHVPDLAHELLKHRYQIINVWRPICNAALDHPLALCDYRTVSWEKDLVPTVLYFAERDGETFSVKYNPKHEWKYQRGMTTDEAVLIKCFDTKMDGSVAILTPHTAFVDPTTPEDAPWRQSIELRALVFYDDLPNVS